MKEPTRIALNWALGLPLVAGLAAWALLPATLWWLQLVLAIAALAVLGYLLQISANWLFGPVLMYELIQQTRSARMPALRVGFATLLLLAMFLVYLSYTPGSGAERVLAALADGVQVPPNNRAQFAANFFYTFIALQFAMLWLFTPAMIAGALASERQRGTLDLLLTTDLTDREIILGKLCSHLAYLLLLLLTGLPILSFLQMLGGVDPDLVIVSFAGTVLSLIGLGALSMFGALLPSRVKDSMVSAYVITASHAGITFVAWVELLRTTSRTTLDGLEYLVLAGYGVYICVAAGFALWFTFRNFRSRLGEGRVVAPVQTPPIRRRRQSVWGRLRLRPAVRAVLGDRDPHVLERESLRR